MFDVVDQRFRLNDEQFASFRKNGFVKLESFLSTEFIQYIKSRITDQMALLDKANTGFNRVGYDIFDDDAAVHALLEHATFAETLTRLTDRSLFFTQGIGFELQKNKHSGFPWHIGTQSFGYSHASDYGCSMWVPLDPIDNSAQAGGMSYVPEHIISGQFMYDHVDPAIDRALADMAEEEDGLTFQDFIELRHGILNSPAMARLLEHHCWTDDFQPGDVLFFNKRVVHASNVLLDGPMEYRCAFVMRFVDIDARYDKRRALGLEFPRNQFGQKPQSDFHLNVCQDDGQIISESPYFRSRERRKLVKR